MPDLAKPRGYSDEDWKSMIEAHKEREAEMLRLTDKDLEDEKHRLETLANHPDYELSVDESEELSAREYETMRREALNPQNDRSGGPFPREPKPHFEKATEWEHSEDNPANYYEDQGGTRKREQGQPELAPLPNPDKEIDAVLDKLALEPVGKSFLGAVIEAIKELPETIREKQNPYRPMLKHQDDREDDNERENSLYGPDSRW